MNMIEFEKIIDDLKEVKQRPMMLVTPLTPENASIFLAGMQRGVLLSQNLMTFSDFVHAYQFAIRNRKLEPTSLNPYRQLREKGMSEEDIIQEMIELEMEMYRMLKKWESEK